MAEHGPSILELLPLEYVKSLTSEARKILEGVYYQMDQPTSRGKYESATNTIHLGADSSIETIQHEATHALNIASGPLNTSGPLSAGIQNLFGGPLSSTLSAGDPNPLTLSGQQRDIRANYLGPSPSLLDRAIYGATRPIEEFATVFQMADFDIANLAPDLAPSYTRFFNSREPTPPKTQARSFDPNKGYIPLDVPPPPSSSLPSIPSAALRDNSPTARQQAPPRPSTKSKYRNQRPAPGRRI